MKAISYQLYLEQPLLATQLAGDPNSSVSFPYIPGGLMRGMLVQRYAAHHGLTDKDNLFAREESLPLFFDGSVRFLHAYPLEEHSRQRLLPTPLGLMQPKKAELANNLTVYNVCHPDVTDERRREIEEQEDDQLKPVRRQFCRFVEGDQAILYKLEPNRIATHVQRERVKGRATSAQGTVFRYEALAEGQWFGGVILADDTVDISELKALLEQPARAWLGRSRSANYGRVSIHNVTEVSNWREVGGSLIVQDSALVQLTLLSDTLLRDSRGQFTTTISSELLEQYLDVPVTVDEAHTLVDATRVGGYNRAWRLPLPQAIALKAGSVITVRPGEPLTADKLAELEERGLGERREEGFGRVVVNWHIDEELKVVLGDLHRRPPHASQETLSDTSKRIARRMAKRLLDAQIAANIQRFVHEQLTDRPYNLQRLQPIKNSQLGRIRVLVRQALNASPPDPALVLDGLKAFKSVAQEQLNNARFEGHSTRGSFGKWLEKLLEPAKAEEHPVWKELGLNSSERAIKVAGQQADLSDAVAHEAALRLIETVCVAISRQRRRSEQVEEVGR